MYKQILPKYFLVTSERHVIFINTFMHYIEFKISDMCLTSPGGEIPSLHLIVKVNKYLET